MKNYQDLTSEERSEIQSKADAYYSAHTQHVDRLINYTEYSYAPSGSDMFRPELWKEAHWRWYFKVPEGKVPRQHKSFWAKLLGSLLNKLKF